MNVIFGSYGNDSVALVQWAHERGLQGVTVLFSDTGWASDDWAARVAAGEDWVRGLGFTPARTSSVGLEALVKHKRAWPRQGMQFCTVELKIKPALAWLDLNDPECQATCLVGVRRAESVNRRNFPERIESSANHGGRTLWAPLVDLSNEQRDELLVRAGYEPLPHRSMECYPCINSNRRDLRVLAEDPDRIAKIERIEDEMGTTKMGKPRTMFRPYHYMGATGIRQVVQWAEAERGKFTLDDGTGEECETGYCGT